MSDITTSDPKFVPSAALLSVIDTKVSEVKTDEALKEFAHRIKGDRQMADAKEAVAVYIARKRGHDFEWVLTELGIDERTAQRREVEGMAILRLQEITRCVSAIRTGSLGIKAVDDITAEQASFTEDGVDERIIKLEVLAASKVIKSTYQPAKGDGPLTDEKVAEIVSAATDKVTSKVEPMTARNIVRAVPTVTEEQGVSVKKRVAQPKTDNGPLGLEAHFKAALADVKRLEQASDGEQYVITPADAKALLDLLTHLGIDSETLAAIDALVAY